MATPDKAPGPRRRSWFVLAIANDWLDRA